MKKYIAILIVVAVAAFMVGAKTAKKKLRFPYAGEHMNGWSNLTKLEVACIEKRFISGEPIAVMNDKKKVYAIERINIKPKKTHIELTAFTGRFFEKPSKADLRNGCRLVHSTISSRFTVPTNKAPYTVVLWHGNSRRVATMDAKGKIKTVLD